MQYHAAVNFFGPDYDGSEAELVGTYEVKANAPPIDVAYKLGPSKLSIIPPGAYIIRYSEGSYLVMAKTPTFLTVGGENGLRVGWACSRTKTWTIAPFNIDYEAADADELRKNISPSQSSSIMQLEFTLPHRLQLIPPSKSVGSVKVKILRYASKPLLHPTEEQLIQESMV